MLEGGQARTVDPGVAFRDESVPRGGSIWLDVARRFGRHRMAVASLVVLVLLAAVSIGAPLLTPYNPGAVNLLQANLPPSPQHLLGTNELGTDFLTQLLYAGRISLLIGFSTMLVACTLGTLVGGIAGYAGGWTDVLLMRLVELMLSFPSLFLLLILISYMGGHASVLLMVLYLGAFGWMGIARLVRAEVLRLRTMEFAEAARAAGAARVRIVARHILPNAIAPVVVAGTFAAAGAMLAEAALDYLGFGLPPGTASWGNMLDNANTFALTQPMWLLWPGIAITVSVVALNFIGDALRDALDPHGEHS